MNAAEAEIDALLGFVQAACKSDLLFKSDLYERLCALLSDLRVQLKCIGCCGNNGGTGEVVSQC